MSASAYSHVPQPPSLNVESVQKLREFVLSRTRLAVITGAGISTESGIPDYRSPNGSYSRGHKPAQYQDFVSSLRRRQKFWARSIRGWTLIKDAQPNPAHVALAEYEKRGRMAGLITQNVDRLHLKAGSSNLVELHGHIDDVACLQCNQSGSRHEYQQRMVALNSGWFSRFGGLQMRADSRADGDIDLDIHDEYYSQFQVPDCDSCGGIMKPTVVYFGENVPAQSVKRSLDIVEASDGVLVIGTSLMVYSSFRFVKQAVASKKPVVIMNIGPTRADDVATLKLEASAAEVLPALLMIGFTEPSQQQSQPATTLNVHV